MRVGTIYWDQFTWQAFATLATGFAAVGGATFVGLRQHDLIRYQASVAERQAATAESAAQVARLKLRADLFDKRMAVYAAMMAYLRAALSTNTEKIWDETPRLAEQLVYAQFLFSNDITERLKLAVNECDTLHDAKLERKEGRAAERDVTDLSAQIRLHRKELRELIQNLAETLGSEMKLYVERA